MSINENTKQRYQERIHKALDYIHKNLYTPLNLEEIAKQSNFSQFHFHRIFHALLNETLNDYFGCSPTSIRNPEKFQENSKIGKIKSKYGKDFDPRKFYPDIINQIQERKMNIQVINQKEKRVAVLASKGGYKEKAIYNTWDKLCEWGGKQ